MISLDTETTGVDFNHGARPFFVTSCDEEGNQLYWEWDVDPLTREVIVPPEEVEEIKHVIWADGDDADAAMAKDWLEEHGYAGMFNRKMGEPGLVLQNSKFDAAALHTLGITNFPWSITNDTVIAGHLLASNQPHDLTSMTYHYLSTNIEPFEQRLEEAVKEGRRMVQQAKLRLKRAETKGLEAEENELTRWVIAGKDVEGMPSAGDGKWKYDTWLPRALAKHLNYPRNHPWWTVLRDYANADSAVTLPLFRRMEKLLQQRGLWKLYEQRLKLLPIVCEMERRGVTLNGQRLEELKTRYTLESESAGRLCVSIADGLGYELVLPKGASPNNSIRKFCFDVLKLPPIRSKKAKTDNPSLDKNVMEHYQATLEPRSKALTFVNSLLGKRSRDTAVAYLNSYQKFWLDSGEGYYTLYPHLNITGSDTLRFTSENPNEQNISKKESFNLRYCFGPAPGREWWSLDFQNLELRIPTFEAGEEELIEVFLHPERPPYYGSYHLVVFDTLHPELFRKHGKACKDLFESTWYQWTKNGNFAVIYGCQEKKADETYHVQGAFKKIQSRFPKIAKLSKKQIELADRMGYVETIPDRSVDPTKGYPLLCTRSEWGRVTPTVPLNYHVQGTAMWLTQQAMIRCEDKLREWRKTGFDAFMVLQVHDELVFDFPKSTIPVKKQLENEKAKKLFRTSGENLCRVRVLQQLMARGGEDIGVPTPVAVEYNETSWDAGVAC